MSNEYLGRITNIREHGKTIFLDIENTDRKIQAIIKKEKFKPKVRAGDFIYIQGHIGKSKIGQESIIAESYHLLNRPKKYIGTSKELRELLVKRHELEQIIRNVFLEEGFIQTDSRELLRYAGTSNIVPFKTKSIDGKELFLRFTMELELKRLICNTPLPLFEIGHLFRNMGISNRRTHEFKVLEAYAPYRNLSYGVSLIKKIMKQVTEKFGIKDETIKEFEMSDLFEKFKSQDKNPEETYSSEIKRSEKPVIVKYQFSHQASPLSKKHNNETVEDVKLFWRGMGTIIHINEEAGDYEDIKKKFNMQLKNLSGKRKDKSIDKDFLKDFANGMPPCLGIYISLDRMLAAIMNKSSINEVIHLR